MQALPPTTRRIVQAVLYETIAVAVCAPAIALVFAHPAGSSLLLALTASTIALLWNYVFNYGFERWEARQAVKGRSPLRRLAHGIGFEGGLALFIVPLLAWWLDITLVAAFMANLALLLFFFVYTIVFTWTFDRVFGLPESAR